MPKTLQQIIKNAGVQGISVAHFANKIAISTEAAGIKKEGGKVQVTKYTLFETASLTKTVFAYIVLKLAERGEIDLDKPLHLQVKDGFGPPHLRKSEAYKALTARNILSHQAGLPCSGTVILAS